MQIGELYNMGNTRFSEAAFIASSTGSFKFQNVEKRDTEKSYVSEWVNSLYGVNPKEKKHIHETNETVSIEEPETEAGVDETALKMAFLEEMNYDPDRIDLDEIYICDGSENYYFNSNVGQTILNNQMLDDWQERHTALKEALEKFEAEFYFDWDEMITEAQVNGEISFGKFTFEGKDYFGYGYFN